MKPEKWPMLMFIAVIGALVIEIRGTYVGLEFVFKICFLTICVSEFRFWLHDFVHALKWRW